MHFNNIKTDQKVWPDVQKPSRTFDFSRNGKQRLFIEERDSVAVLRTKVGSPFQRYIQKSIALEQEKRKLKTPDISKFTISE